MFTTDELFSKGLEYESLIDTIMQSTGAYIEDPVRLRQEFEALPESIRNIAHIWGLHDTVFRDEAYEHWETHGLNLPPPLAP